MPFTELVGCFVLKFKHVLTVFATLWLEWFAACDGGSMYTCWQALRCNWCMESSKTVKCARLLREFRWHI
jgi:hypothetical protein